MSRHPPISADAGSITGLTSGQVGFGSSTGSLTGESTFTWDATNDRLVVGADAASHAASNVDFMVKKASANVFSGVVANLAAGRGIAFIEGGTSGSYSSLQLRAHGPSYVETAFGGSVAGDCLIQMTPVNKGVIGTYNATALVFGTNNSERMRIASGGAVTMTDGLTVTGSVNATVQQQVGGVAFASSTATYIDVGSISGSTVRTLRLYGNDVLVCTADATTVQFPSTHKIGIGGGSTFGGGTGGVICIGNAAAVPSTNPTSSGLLYAEAGALKYRGSSGTITTLGVA